MNYQEKFQKHQELRQELNKKLSIIEKIFTGPNEQHQEWYNEQIQKIYGPYDSKNHEIKWW